MPKKVILVRHGQAEDRSSLVPDGQRRLTTEGLEAIERAYSAYFCDVAGQGEEVTVLASAALRTMQTARVVCRVLGVDEDDIVNLGALTNQNAEWVINDIFSRDGVVVAVGHSPSIDEVASELSGRLRMMACGEALCLDAEGRYRRMPVLWDCTPR